MFSHISTNFTGGLVHGVGFLVVVGLTLIGIAQATDSLNWNPGQTPLAGPGSGNVATLPSCPSGEYMVSDGSWWDCDAVVPTPEGNTNWLGDGSLGTAQFSTTGISQTGGSVDIDSVLSTGTKMGGPGASSYGGGLPSSGVYEFTVPNKDGQYDGDMTVVQLESLTIDENVWLTTDQPGRGLLIYVKEDLVVNGTLSMTARGASTPNINNEVNSGGLQYPAYIAGHGSINTNGDFTGAGTEAENIISGINVDGEGKVFVIEREGADGGPGGYIDQSQSSPSYGLVVGQEGYNGNPGQSGGGAGGNGRANPPVAIAVGGEGEAGTCFSGGAGGGGSARDSGTGVLQAGAASSNGGIGGYGRGLPDNADYFGRGGVGNPGGSNSGGIGGVAPSGTGGLLILVVGGKLSGTGSILAEGSSGIHVPSNSYGTSGGGSGGGNILILYGGSNNDSFFLTISSSGTISGNSQKGGNGSVQVTQIDTTQGLY